MRRFLVINILAIFKIAGLQEQLPNASILKLLENTKFYHSLNTSRIFRQYEMVLLCHHHPNKQQSQYSHEVPGKVIEDELLNSLNGSNITSPLSLLVSNKGFTSCTLCSTYRLDACQLVCGHTLCWSCVAHIEQKQHRHCIHCGQPVVTPMDALLAQDLLGICDVPPRQRRRRRRNGAVEGHEPKVSSEDEAKDDMLGYDGPADQEEISQGGEEDKGDQPLSEGGVVEGHNSCTPVVPAQLVQYICKDCCMVLNSFRQAQIHTSGQRHLDQVKRLKDRAAKEGKSYESVGLQVHSPEEVKDLPPKPRRSRTRKKSNLQSGEEGNQVSLNDGQPSSGGVAHCSPKLPNESEFGNVLSSYGSFKGGAGSSYPYEDPSAISTVYSSVEGSNREFQPSMSSKKALPVTGAFQHGEKQLQQFSHPLIEMGAGGDGAPPSASLRPTSGSIPITASGGQFNSPLVYQNYPYSPQPFQSVMHSHFLGHGGEMPYHPKVDPHANQGEVPVDGGGGKSAKNFNQPWLGNRAPGNFSHMAPVGYLDSGMTGQGFSSWGGSDYNRDGGSEIGGDMPHLFVGSEIDVSRLSATSSHLHPSSHQHQHQHQSYQKHIYHPHQEYIPPNASSIGAAGYTFPEPTSKVSAPPSVASGVGPYSKPHSPSMQIAPHPSHLSSHPGPSPWAMCGDVCASNISLCEDPYPYDSSVPPTLRAGSVHTIVYDDSRSIVHAKPAPSSVSDSLVNLGAGVNSVHPCGVLAKAVSEYPAVELPAPPPHAFKVDKEEIGIYRASIEQIIQSKDVNNEALAHLKKTLKTKANCQELVEEIFSSILNGELSSEYAKLCASILDTKDLEMQLSLMEFKHVLLQYCQKYALEVISETELSSDMSSEQIDTLEEFALRSKFRRNTAIRFTADLYVLGILPEALVHLCIQTLLFGCPVNMEDDALKNFKGEGLHEESVASACRVLLTVVDTMKETKSRYVDLYIRVLTSSMLKISTKRVIKLMKQVIDKLEDTLQDTKVPPSNAAGTPIQNAQRSSTFIKTTKNFLKSKTLTPQLSSKAPPVNVPLLTPPGKKSLIAIDFPKDSLII